MPNMQLTDEEVDQVVAYFADAQVGEKPRWQSGNRANTSRSIGYFTR